ncbi:OmpA family protein [Alteraurantiacibacter buctensis]|uniref:OmpA family protein n=1 Tax=Alteraurantiacibacter buctensis TaxID=1503981 RepID=A0A844YZ60_9SPHN|nr:OmpA family protein [Alteraurantiacibacter buctensis]MXO72348.1 OmpA family protein [Alteraurantiacibacter buctensis]
MQKFTKSPALLLAAVAGVALTAPAGAQSYNANEGVNVTVTADVPSNIDGLSAGPDIEGIVSARDGDRVQITSPDGSTQEVWLSSSTRIRSTGGFLGTNRTDLTRDQLINGMNVEVETLNWTNGLIASSVRMSNRDARTAQMIQHGTNQRFARNEAATEALRGRVANIDQYNIHGTTNVNFDTGKWNLTPAAEAELCRTAQQAQQTPNALLLVVGYTDDVGDEDFNQQLSERRAARVTNFLQQRCGWQPWRMMTPTGMSESDPTADNTTEAGRAANRRVAVNILVSKAVDGIQDDASLASR